MSNIKLNRLYRKNGIDNFNEKMDKKKLAITLSKLKQTLNKKVNLEQYQTESELAARILWTAYTKGDIKNKIIADLGCGNGIFGIGALLLNAKKVYFVDLDDEAISISKENSKNFKNISYVNCEINEFTEKVDTILMNPPFGVQNRKADKIFLIKAFEISNVIYSIHKIESKNFIEVISKEYNFKIEEIITEKLILKKTYKFHKTNKYNVDIGIWILRKNE